MSVMCKICSVSSFVSPLFLSNYSMKHSFMKCSIAIIPYVFPVRFDPEDKSSLEQCYVYPPIISSAPFTFYSPLRPFSSRMVFYTTCQLLELTQFFAASSLCTFCSLSLERSFPTIFSWLFPCHLAGISINNLSSEKNLRH